MVGYSMVYVGPDLHNTNKGQDEAPLHRPLRHLLPPPLPQHLAAQSNIVAFFQIPQYIIDIVATGTLRLLESTRSHLASTGMSQIQYYQISSSKKFESTLLYGPRGFRFSPAPFTPPPRSHAHTTPSTTPLFLESHKKATYSPFTPSLYKSSPTSTGAFLGDIDDHT
ncbi:hypothetical protein Tsubulata_049175 [Turnera subulata]|uniref:NAD(P)-binding domain-containing protein n=1 Tax=Turnera subulata TaxID=218843 RepID=A0A9Q0F0N3_9ROSI|nr:hypothetical protein Tsubulata_049175 [Turnera subulata]